MTNIVVVFSNLNRDGDRMRVVANPVDNVFLTVGVEQADGSQMACHYLDFEAASCLARELTEWGDSHA